MRGLRMLLIGALALALAPAAAAQQKKFKDEGLQQYLVPEITQIQTKLDKLTERLAALEAQLGKLKEQQAAMAEDLRNMQSLQRATDSSVTSLRGSNQQDLLGIKTDVVEIRRNINDLADLLRKNMAPPASSVAPSAPPAPAPNDGYITQVSGSGVTISLGSSNGVKAGMRFNVFRASDPQFRIGVVEVTDVLDANNSRAKVINRKPDVKFEFSDIVRPI